MYIVFYIIVVKRVIVKSDIILIIICYLYRHIRYNKTFGKIKIEKSSRNMK